MFWRGSPAVHLSTVSCVSRCKGTIHRWTALGENVAPDWRLLKTRVLVEHSYGIEHLVGYLFEPFVHFKNWVVFLLWSYFYILDTTPLSDMQGNICSRSVGCPLTLLVVSFSAQKGLWFFFFLKHKKILILMGRVQLIFFLFSLCFQCQIRNHCLIQGHKDWDQEFWNFTSYI